MFSRYIALSSLLSVAFAGIYEDLQTVDAKVNICKADVNGLSSPATGAQIVQLTNDDNILNNAIKAAYNTCQATAASSITTAYANQVINYCVNPLEPDIYALVQALIAAQPKLQNVRPLVRTQLGYTKGNTTLLNNCLLSKTPASPTSLRINASSCISKVNNDIQSAVNAYATPP